MAVYEQNTLLRCKDENGNEYLLYPITKLDCVDGAEDLVHFDKEQELTAIQKAQFLKNIGGLCAPESARANQFLKVSAVDENGHITAVETAEVEGGGSGKTVQSDWNVFDETNAAYIKNRPFYDAEGSIKYLDNKFLSFMEHTIKDVIPENDFVVEWDALSEQWISRSDSAQVSTEQIELIKELVEADRRIDVEINGTNHNAPIVSTQINGLYRSFAFGDDTFGDYPFFCLIEKSSVKMFFSRQDINFDGYMFGLRVGSVSPPPFGLELEKTYKVIWDNEEYTLTGMDGSIISPGAVFIGNAEAFGFPGNNAPFIIAYSPGYDVTFMSLTDNAPSTHNVAVYQIVSEDDSVEYSCRIYLKDEMLDAEHDDSAEVKLHAYTSIPNKIKQEYLPKRPDLPEVSISDNGKFLRVVNGVWTAVTIPAAEEARF